MINDPIYVFDSIGSKFSILNNNFLIGQAIAGYNTLTASHAGSYIPYLARNGKVWEIGVGLIGLNNDGIFVERTKVVRSSSSNKMVDFGLDLRNTEFYIFANEFGFNSGFNNVIVKNSSFNADPVQSVYLVDTENSNIETKLPHPNKSENITIQFKVISDLNNLYIRNNEDKIISNLSSADRHAVFVCDGNSWFRLNDKDPVKFSSLSSSNFSALADPSGSDLSFQYKVQDGEFGGADFYYGVNNKLLLGSDSEETAHTIIPVTGSDDTVFNADNQQADFIVHGSGVTDKNLFFDYRGRLGLNIPSGSAPSTILHIINTTCREGIRLENRTSCHPSNVTLYYKPSSDLSNNETVGLVNLAAKDTNGNQTNFVQLESVAVDNTANSSKGRFNLTVATTSVDGTGVKTIQTDPDLTVLGYSDNNLTINKEGNTKIGYSGSNATFTSSNVSITGTSINLNGSVNFGTNNITSNGSFFGNYIQANTFKFQNIAEGSLLSVNSSGYAVAGSDVKLPNLGSGYILTTVSGGSITGIYQLNDYFLTNGDILWNKYDNRDCSVALRQITFVDDDVSVNEFTVGDQVEIEINGTKFYRDIQEIESDDSVITSLLVNQNVTSNTIETATITSVTKGGYLSIGRTVDPGTATDSTSNIISIRPGTDTVFNSSQKDVNFSVYGVDPEPAIKVQASAGLVKVPSGIYHAFATLKSSCNPCDIYVPAPDTEVFPIVVATGGNGLSSAHASANFNYTASGIFSGMLTDVGTNGLPSFYGTYDQNGNASEWVVQNNENGKLIATNVNGQLVNETQVVAGGSWKTETHDVIGSSGLKSIMYMPKVSGYEEVGFRVASLYSLVDNDNVSDENNLDMKFVSVENPKNFADENGIYLFNYDPNNDPDTDDQYVELEIENLGTVNKNYRIGKFEITNKQYAKFLNAIGKTDSRECYNSLMSSSDRGGINRVGDGGITVDYEYIVKNNMDNKPVVFVNYLSVLRFINWLHNGAELDVTEDDVDSYINYGAYDIFDNDIRINIYQKYWLPSINEWHKAAYYEPVNGAREAGSSAVMIKREEPYVVATGYDPNGDNCTTLANLSVSGWLYVDHIIVGDGTIRSAKKFANCGDLTGSEPVDTGGDTADAVFNNDNTNTSGGGTTCVGDDCPDPSDPSVGGGQIGDSGSTNDDDCSGDDPPPYCDDNWDGPTWF